MPVTDFLCCRGTSTNHLWLWYVPGMHMQRSATIVVSMYVEHETVQNNTATGAR